MQAFLTFLKATALIVVTGAAVVLVLFQIEDRCTDDKVVFNVARTADTIAATRTFLRSLLGAVAIAARP
jgi:hypothetical protein